MNQPTRLPAHAARQHAIAYVRALADGDMPAVLRVEGRIDPGELAFALAGLVRLAVEEHAQLRPWLAETAALGAPTDPTRPTPDEQGHTDPGEGHAGPA